MEEIGWEMAGRVKVYYCIPILAVNKNGLREIRSEHDTDQMLTFLSIGHHFFSMYVDHDNSLVAKLNVDDVVYRPVANLPPVISPRKAVQSAGNDGDQQEEQAELTPLNVVYPEEEVQDHLYQTETTVIQPQEEHEQQQEHAAMGAGTSETANGDSDDSQDSDFDPGSLVDSDFNISDGDDDLYADNVDEDETVDQKKTIEEKGKLKGEAKGKQTVQDNGRVNEKEEAKEEYESEGEDLWGPDSDDEVANKFRIFRREDLHSPKFHIGQVFVSVDLLRTAIKEYSCKNRVDIRMPVNDKKRLKVVCDEDCTWYLWASMDSRTNCFMVKKYVEEHTCSKKWNVTGFTAPFLAKKYLESFRADQDMNLRNFSRVVQKKWHMTPGRTKLQRARRLAMKIIHGDEAGQYKMLWDYANEIRRSNPGSSFFVALDDQARFNKAYMCIDACKRGFLLGCRPIIFIDGCHIKTRYRGQLLAAVGIDPNNCIFPIAIGVVEVVDKPNWCWFLERLKMDLGIVNTTPWTIMSDKQKVTRSYCLSTLLLV